MTENFLFSSKFARIFAFGSDKTKKLDSNWFYGFEKSETLTFTMTISTYNNW